MNIRINRIFLSMFLLGYSSGLPLALTSGTLQAWLTVEDIDIRTIGLFSLAGLPYTLKFLWSPLMDYYVPPWLDRRRGWILLCQIGLILCLVSIAQLSPRQDLQLMVWLVMLLAFLSASQDIAYDAYRTDLLAAEDRGLGTAFSITGYRLAMLTSGALALIFSEHIGWRNTYLCMAGFMLLGLLSTAISAQPPQHNCPPATLFKATVEPLQEFFSRSQATLWLLLICIYKLSDAFAGTLTTSFLIRELTFTASEVGIINKGMGMAASILGVMAGGYLLKRIDLYLSLMIFGILQAITNLGFAILAGIGKSYLGMAIVVVLENFSGGMGTAAFVALLMSLCDNRYTATQFALLSAIAALSRVFIGPISGYLVTLVGWSTFFTITCLLALPAIIIVKFFKHQLIKLNQIVNPISTQVN